MAYECDCGNFTHANHTQLASQFLKDTFRDVTIVPKQRHGGNLDIKVLIELKVSKDVNILGSRRS